MQGTDDLEEVLSERLQELPPPLSRGPSGSGPAARQQSAEDFSFPEDMDTSAEQAKVGQQLQQPASYHRVGGGSSWNGHSRGAGTCTQGCLWAGGLQAVERRVIGPTLGLP